MIFEEVLRINNCFWNIFFRYQNARAVDDRAENIRDDLGLSGPVVATFESYWPAKSQVISVESAMVPFIN